jgi:hypothetical protein
LGNYANSYRREDLREQHAIGEEIGEAITQSIGNQGLDESELDEELEALQQEELDSKMLHTGNVPADQIGRLPSAPEAGKSTSTLKDSQHVLIPKQQSKAKLLHRRKKKMRKQSSESCKLRWPCDFPPFSHSSSLASLFSCHHSTAYPARTTLPLIMTEFGWKASLVLLPYLGDVLSSCRKSRHESHPGYLLSCRIDGSVFFSTRRGFEMPAVNMPANVMNLTAAFSFPILVYLNYHFIHLPLPFILPYFLHFPALTKTIRNYSRYQVEH